MKTNTTTLEPNSTHPAQRLPAAKIHYTDLTRGAALCGIRPTVLLETRVLEEFAELDPALGSNPAGIILAVLGFHLINGHAAGDDRLTVCLVRRRDGRQVEVDLMLLPRRQAGGERIYLRLAGVRAISPLTSDTNQYQLELDGRSACLN